LSPLDSEVNFIDAM